MSNSTYEYSSELYSDLCNEDKLNDIAKVLMSEYDDNTFSILLKLPKGSRSKCRGISIAICENKYHNSLPENSSNKIFIIETALLGRYDGSIFNADLIYDKYCGYEDTKRFTTIDDLVNEIIYVQNFYLHNKKSNKKNNKKILII